MNRSAPKEAGRAPENPGGGCPEFDGQDINQLAVAAIPALSAG